MKKYYKIPVKEYYEIEHIKDTNEDLEIHNKTLRAELQKQNSIVKNLIDENKNLKETNKKYKKIVSDLNKSIQRKNEIIRRKG